MILQIINTLKPGGCYYIYIYIYIYTTLFNALKLCILSIVCICEVRIVLTVNSVSFRQTSLTDRSLERRHNVCSVRYALIYEEIIQSLNGLKIK
jgi:hypothetical protein